MAATRVRNLILFVCLASCGCTIKEAVEDLRPTDFLSRPEKLVPPESTPFDLAWIAPDVSTWLFGEVVVDAVRSDSVDAGNWIFSAGTFLPTRAAYIEQVTELADYIQKVTIEEFEAEASEADVDVKKGAAVEAEVETAPIPALEPALKPEETAPLGQYDPIRPQSRTLLVQISITEVNFGDPVVYGGLLTVPVPAVANLSTTVKSPSLTLETRLVDQETGQVVAELMDRRFPQVKIVDVNRLTVSSAVRELAASFAHDLAKSFYRKPGERVGRRFPFSLLPW